MTVERIDAVIPTLDVAASLGFYQNIFTSSDVFYPGDEKEYAVLIVDGTASMHFSLVSKLPETERHSLMIFVDDADVYHDRCKELSVNIVTPIQDDNGLREFRIRDNNGYLIVIAK